jgi:preprotein translocase subunit SecD
MKRWLALAVWTLPAIAAACSVASTTPGSTTEPSVAVSPGVAHVQLRQVLEVTPSDDPNWQNLHPVCATDACPDVILATNREVVAQDDQGNKFHLGPAFVTDSDVSGAKVIQTVGGTDTWAIDVTLDDVGTNALSKVTRSLLSQAAPKNQIAVLVDGVVAEAPTVQAAITQGLVEIHGNLSETRARAIVSEITG